MKNKQSLMEILFKEIEETYAEMRIEMMKGITGNIKAQKRARVKTIEMRDQMKEYRTLTMEIKKNEI